MVNAEGTAPMLSLGSTPIYLYSEPTDMRKSYQGLSGLVEAAFKGKLMSGALFVFVNRRRTMVKALYWDEDGFAIWSKRLERGTFKLRSMAGGLLTRRELALLLEELSRGASTAATACRKAPETGGSGC